MIPLTEIHGIKMLLLDESFHRDSAVCWHFFSLHECSPVQCQNSVFASRQSVSSFLTLSSLLLLSVFSLSSTVLSLTLPAKASITPHFSRQVNKGQGKRSGSGSDPVENLRKRHKRGEIEDKNCVRLCLASCWDKLAWSVPQRSRLNFLKVVAWWRFVFNVFVACLAFRSH